LTTRVAGDERPKQFCALLGGETLLDQTRRRAALTIQADRTLVVVTRPHERYYAPLLADLPSRCLVVQPENRGTAPAILLSLLRVAAAAPADPVAVFPSDHYVSDEPAFVAHVEAAFKAVTARPDLVVLLGMAADSPEVEYGWIEPAEPIAVRGAGTLYRVSRFWEKPSPALARTFWARGYLWNSFVMIAGVPAFLSLIRSAAPALWEEFNAIRPAIGSPEEEKSVRALYSRLPSMNFSRQVLATRPANLAVLPVSGIGWSDWGTPHRVLATLARHGIHPEWATPAVAQPA
jgi:mannose-1-phosphate guanylyltransferase